MQEYSNGFGISAVAFKPGNSRVASGEDGTPIIDVQDQSKYSPATHRADK